MKRSLFALMLMSLAACGEEEKGGDPINGESVYNASCASCHGSAGSGLSGPELPGTSTEEDIANAIENGIGSMPPGLITGTDIDDVIAYLMTL